MFSEKGFITDDVIKWIITGVSSIALTVGSMWLNHLNTEMEKIKEQSQLKFQKMAQLEYVGEESARRLNRIEDKLDRVLEVYNKKK